MKSIIKNLWPFVLKSTAVKTIREEIGKARIEATAREFDYLFMNLPPFQWSRYSQFTLGGIALLNAHGMPMGMKKFRNPTAVGESDTVTITL